LIAELAPSEIRATAIGLHATISGVGLFPASLIAAERRQHVGPSSAFYFGGRMGIIMALRLLIML